MQDNSTKTLIIALDGLEYTYINGGDYPNIKQLEYGMLTVPILDAGEPSTPIVWTSFMTGKTPQEHGVSTSNVYHNRFIGSIMGWIEASISNQILRRVLIVLTPIREHLKKLRMFQTHQPTKKAILVPTIFDIIPSSISVSVPMLNYDVDVRYKGILKAIIDPKARKIYVEFLMKDFERDKQQFAKVLNKYRLIMVHFQLPDLYGHIYCQDLGRMKGLYHKLDEYVFKVIQQLDDDCWILIIADHGIDRNFGHTSYGYYSSNVPLGLDNANIMDFYDLILERMT